VTLGGRSFGRTGVAENRTRIEYEIQKAEQYETLNRCYYVCWTIRKFGRKLSLCRGVGWGKPG